MSEDKIERHSVENLRSNLNKNKDLLNSLLKRKENLDRQISDLQKRIDRQEFVLRCTEMKV